MKVDRMVINDATYLLYNLNGEYYVSSFQHNLNGFCLETTNKDEAKNKILSMFDRVAV